ATLERPERHLGTRLRTPDRLHIEPVTDTSRTRPLTERGLRTNHRVGVLPERRLNVGGALLLLLHRLHASVDRLDVDDDLVELRLLVGREVAGLRNRLLRQVRDLLRETVPLSFQRVNNRGHTFLPFNGAVLVK